MKRNMQHWLIPGRRGVTPLHDAAQNGRLDIVPKELLNSDSLLKITHNGSTVIHYAAEYGHLDQIPIDRLLGKSGQSALKRAFDLVRKAAIREKPRSMFGPILTKEEKKEQVRNQIMLIPNAFDVLNAQSNMLIPNKLGTTPLHLAAYNGCLDQAPADLICEKNINLPNNNGTSVIQLAFRSKSAYQLPQRLITTSTMRRKDKDGDTAFHFAAEAGTLDAIPVELLTEENLLIPNKEGVTPMHNAGYFLHINQIPKQLLTAETLLTIDIRGRTVLEALANNVSDDIQQLDSILGIEFPESMKKIVGEKWWKTNEDVRAAMHENKHQLTESDQPSELEIY